MKRIFWFFWLTICVLLAGAARCHNLASIFVEGRIYFVDADCYSRMTRAQMVLQGPARLIRHHEFENWPAGVTPHTTAPFDYLILFLRGIVHLGLGLIDPQHTSVLSGQELDVAGALISPLLGMIICAFLGCWAIRCEKRDGQEETFQPRWAAAFVPFCFAVSPILVHGTLLGRPDHQSLLILLLSIALAAEGMLLQRLTRFWSVISGLGWGTALWVSLYEPLVLLVIIAATWLILAPRSIFSRERIAGWILMLVIVLGALLMEGWRVSLPDPALRAFLSRWGHSIGELQPLPWTSPLLFRWLGFGIAAAPVLLFLNRQDRRAWFWMILLLSTLALTAWQVRWGYFLALIYSMSLPVQMAALRKSWIAWPLFISALWPIAKDWDEQLFPEFEAERQLSLQRKENVLLREIADQMAVGKKTGFIAPWWLSPPLAYWSGRPGVGGSSHESIGGNVDNARFYLQSDLDQAAAILRDRNVQWIVVDEPSRIIANSADLLGQDPSPRALALRLANFSERKLPFASLVFENQFYRLWKVDREDAIAPH